MGAKIRYQSNSNLAEGGVTDANGNNSGSNGDSGRPGEGRKTRSKIAFKRDSKADATIGISPHSAETIKEIATLEGDEPEAHSLEETGNHFTCENCTWPLLYGESPCPSCKAEMNWKGLNE